MLAALLVSSLAVCVVASSASAAATLGLQWRSFESAEDAEEWTAIGKSGAGFFRFPIKPAETEGGNNWSKYDTIFGYAAQQGVTILPVFEDRLNGQLGLPTAGEKIAWGEWAKKVVRRYGYNGTFWTSNPGIPYKPAIAWELYNEPNNAGMNGGQIPAAEYGQFIAWAGPEVQGASESWGGQKTGVLFGGLLSMGTGTNYQTYFINAYKMPGAKNGITGVAYHPYTVETPDNQTKINQTKNAITGMRNMLNANEAAGKSLWITEFGWPTRSQFAVTEGAQANMLLQTVGWMKAEASKLDLHSIIWYFYRDHDANNAQWQWACGLRDEIGNFRKSWFAFQKESGAPRWPLPRMAMQANTGNLFTYTKTGGGLNTLLGMKAGTSPSIGQYRGSHLVAVHANTGNLFTWTPSGGGVNTTLGMAAGTSPSVAPIEGGRVAFQANTGTLWTYDPGLGGVNTGLEMMPGTSPSITSLWRGHWVKPLRFPIAYHAKNGNLAFTDGKGGVVNTGLGMKAGTSPAIAGLDSGGSEFAIAFQANTGQLWLYEPGGTVASTGLGVQAKTSPTIASLPNGNGKGSYTIAFQANTGQLWLYNPGGAVGTTGIGMQAESSPSVIGLGELPHEASSKIAFHVNTGQMWTYEPGGDVLNTLLGSNPATSPSIAPG